MATLKNTTVSDTGAIQLPVGTTAQRPVSPSVGQMRYNSTFKTVESYDGTRWRYMPDIVRGGLVLHLDAGEPSSYSGSGTTWTDLSGNGYNGTLTNGPTYSSANGGNIVFDGTNDQIDLVNKNFSVTGNSSRSIFCWVKSTTSGRCIVSTGTPATGQAFNLVTYGSGKVGVMGYNLDFYPTTGVNIFDGAWHFVGAIADGFGTTTTYVDGNLENIGTGLTYSTTGQNNYIARSNHVGNENYWAGSISEVKYYNRALTAKEIKQNYEAMRGRFGL